MLALAHQIPGWKDFPRGLHIMLVDQDLDVIKDLKCKLDSCGYSVTSYTRGEDALQALEDKSQIFHVVVVDATRNDTFDGFKIVAAAKQLTTIMMASTENMNIMMQGIAAGASEFLQKPLSEERLKNVWQHVVRKALVSGDLVPPTTLGKLANDLKCKATPKQNACSGASDGFGSATFVKQEEVDHSAHNAYQADETAETSVSQEFLFHEDAQHYNPATSSFMDMDGRDNCDAFLCSTPPQLEHSCTRIVPTDHEDNMELGSSPQPSASHELALKGDLKEMHDYFDDCDDYLHIKSEVDEAVNNSVILNDLFDSKSQINSDNFLLIPDDHQSIRSEEFVNSKLCADLQLDDIPDSLDDITLGGDLLDDATDQSLSMGLDCLDDEEFQEADEETPLRYEAAKNEEKFIQTLGCTAVSSNNNVCDNSGQNRHQSNCTGTVACPGSASMASEAQEEMKSKSDSEQSCSTKGSKSSNGKKKMKVDWTPELHRRFVQAVEQLGVDKAIPSRILELMGVKCLTRHNIASHLQKYRSHRKHVQAREAEAASWNQRRHIEAASVAVHGGRTTPSSTPLRPQQQQPAWPSVRPPPTAAAQPLQPRTMLSTPATPVLHVWGHPTTIDPPMHFWPAWPPPGCQLDAWGNPFYPAQPIVRLPLAPMPSVANMAWPPSTGKVPTSHPPKELVVAAINEVLRNPYVPLPLGLKSPSLESVVCELQRQGISMSPTATV